MDTVDAVDLSWLVPHLPKLIADLEGLTLSTNRIRTKMKVILSPNCNLATKRLSLRMSVMVRKHVAVEELRTRDEGIKLSFVSSCHIRTGRLESYLESPGERERHNEKHKQCHLCHKQQKHLKILVSTMNVGSR